MRRRLRRHPSQRACVHSFLQQLLLLVAAAATYHASAETKVSRRKAPAAVKVKAPAAVKVPATSAVKAKVPPAVKAKAPPAVKAKVPTAEQAQAPSAVKAKVPTAVKAKANPAVKAKVPTAEQAQAPAAVKVKAQAPAAVKSKAPPAVKAKASTTPKAQAPAAVKVKVPAAAKVKEPVPVKVRTPTRLKAELQHSSPAAVVVTADAEVLPTQASAAPPPAVKVKPKLPSASPVAGPAAKVKPQQRPAAAPPVRQRSPASPAVKVKTLQPSASAVPSKQPAPAPPALKVKLDQPSTTATPDAKAPQAVKARPAAKVGPAQAPAKAVKTSNALPTKTAETHSLHFAEAAWHASGLRALLDCGTGTEGGNSTPCSAGRAAQRGWQYAVNNVLLALRHAGGAARSELASGLSADLAKAVSALAEFDAAAGSTAALATTAVAAAAAAVVAAFRQLFSESRRKWLASLPAAGTNFSGTFRSVKLPVEGHGIVDVGRVLVKLKSGFSMPMLSFGTQPPPALLPPSGPRLTEDVLSALEAGCKHLNIEPGLPSELAVGEAIQRFVSNSGSPATAREQLFLTLRPGSVAWDRPSAVAVTLAAQLKALRVDYVDLYLLPGPGPDSRTTARIWEAYEALISSGQSRSIGVANFTASQLETLLVTAKKQPDVVQTTYSIYAPGPGAWEEQDKDVLDQVARPKGMVMLADGVLSGGPAVLAPPDDPHVRAIAEARSRSSSQVLLRWAMQRGMAVVLPREHREESAGAFTFELSEFEMAVLSHLAVLAETTPLPRPGARHRPPWKADVFSLMRSAAMLEPLLGDAGSLASQAA